MLLHITQKSTRLSHISVILTFTEIYERLKVKYKRADCVIYYIFAEDRLHLSKNLKQAWLFAFGLHYLCIVLKRV